MALRSMAPCFGVGAVLGAVDAAGSNPLLAVWTWTLFYGLGLLSTQHFAPRSVVVLGWLFVVAPVGQAALFIGLATMNAPEMTGAGNESLISSLLTTMGPDEEKFYASLLMALTFGLFHLVYALGVRLSLRKERAS